MPESKRSLPRPSWSGTISFGLVSIPVNLYPATRMEHLPLRTLSQDGKPLRREYYCPEHETAVTNEELVRGYEVSDGTFVVVTDEELESLAPDKSRDIDLRRFVPQEQLSPAYFERAHFMTPAADSTKAYRLLAETLERTGRVGLATFVMRGKEYVVAILAAGGVLRAETMRFSNQLRAPADIGLPERKHTPTAAHVRQLRQLLEKQKKKNFDTEQLENRALRRAHELVEKKLASGKDVVEAPNVEEVSDIGRENILDLMAALKKSLAANDAKTNSKSENGSAAQSPKQSKSARATHPGPAKAKARPKKAKSKQTKKAPAKQASRGRATARRAS
ncbi:MAG TPA: Ku protein [Polyangiaceae bacterium]|nr:Ku protein [Polyangiaceae bacterium]